MILKDKKKTINVDMDFWWWQMSDEVYKKCKLKNKMIDKMEFESGDIFEFDEITITMKNVKMVVE